MAKQTFTAGQTLTAQQMNDLQTNDFNMTVSVKTDAYTFVVGDRGTRVVLNSATARTFTIDNSIFSAGDTINVHNINTGVLTIAAGTGVTLNTADLLTVAQWQSGTIYFTSASSALFFATATVPQIAIFNESQASGTNGGASTQAFKKRTLNTTVRNSIAGCSISSSVITLATPGTYYFYGSTPGYECFGIKSKVRNTTAGTDVGIGQNVACSVGTSPGGTSSIVECVATITASTNFELQSRETDIKATNGLGGAYTFGVDEIYSQLYIERIA